MGDSTGSRVTICMKGLLTFQLERQLNDDKEQTQNSLLTSSRVKGQGEGFLLFALFETVMSKQTYEVSLERYEFIVMQLKHNPIHVACFRGQMFHVTSALLIKARLTCVLRILRSADDLLSPSSCSMLCSIAAGKQTEQVQH